MFPTMLALQHKWLPNRCCAERPYQLWYHVRTGAVQYSAVDPDLRKYQIPNTKYTCDTGQTRNKHTVSC